MRLVSVILLFTGIFIFTAGLQVPVKGDHITLFPDGGISEKYEKILTFDLYPGQDMEITIRSNFTITLNLTIQPRVGERKLMVTILNDVVVQNISQGFPTELYSFEEFVKKIGADQLTRLTVNITYDPSSVFSEDIGDASVLFEIERQVEVFISVGDRSIDWIMYVSVVIVLSALVIEGTSRLIPNQKSNDSPQKLEPASPSDNTANVIQLFLRVENLDLVFGLISLLGLLLIYNELSLNLYDYVFSSQSPTLKITEKDILSQLALNMMVITGFLVYGHMDVRSLRSYLTLPIRRTTYLLTSEVMVLFRTGLQILFYMGILSWFTFSVVYGVRPSFLFPWEIWGYLALTVSSLYLLTVMLGSVQGGSLAFAVIISLLYILQIMQILMNPAALGGSVIGSVGLSILSVLEFRRFEL